MLSTRYRSKNRLNSSENVLESRVMLMGAATPSPESALTEVAAAAEETSNPSEGNVVTFIDAVNSLPAVPDDAPSQISVPVDVVQRLNGLFSESLDSGVEEFTTFDRDGNELPVTEVFSAEENSASFTRPNGGVVRAHTHFVDPSTDETGVTGDFTLPNSPGDLVDFVTQESDSENPLLGGLVQAGEVTYFALATDATLNTEFPRNDRGLVNIDIAAFFNEQIVEFENARSETSEAGELLTLRELQVAEDDAAAALWSDYGLVLYRGVSGGAADGSTTLERINFEEDRNLFPADVSENLGASGEETTTRERSVRRDQREAPGRERTPRRVRSAESA